MTTFLRVSFPIVLPYSLKTLSSALSTYVFRRE